MAQRKNENEAEERAHLKDVLAILREQLENVGDDVSTTYYDMLTMKQYLHDSLTDMDHAEKMEAMVDRL